MTSQVVESVRTFADLRLAQDVGGIPLQKITRLSLNSLRRQETDLEVYEFLFNRAVQHFELFEFESEVCDVVLPELVKHLCKLESELKDQALSCFLDDNLKSLLGLANIMLKFLEHVASQAQVYQVYGTVLVFMDFLVRAFAVVAQKKPGIEADTPERTSIEQLAAACRSLQIKMVSMVAAFNGTGYYFQHLDVEQEFDCLKNVIICFGKIGCTTIQIDLIDAKHAWQAILVLSTKHLKYIAQNDTCWLHELILSMNDEIDKLLKSLVANANAGQIELKTLKFLNLMLQLMLRLLRSIKLEELDCFGQLLDTIVSISKALLAQSLEKEAVEAIRSNLKVGYMSLIGMSFRTSSFAKALAACRYESWEELAGYFEIVIEVISKLLAEDSNSPAINLYMSKTNLLSACIEHLPKAHVLINKQESLYQKLITHLAGFVLQCARKPPKSRQKLLEETLVRMILQDSFWVGVAGLDIWNAFLRLTEPDLHWQYFRFWKTINDQFPVFSTQPRVVFVRRLLRNMFVFMPPRMQRRARDEFPGTVNCKLWIAVELKNAGEDMFRPAKIEEFGVKVRDGLTSAAAYDLMHTLTLACTTSDRRVLETTARNVGGLLKSVSVKNLIDPNLTTLICVFLRLATHLKRHGCCPQEFDKFVRTTILSNCKSLELAAKLNALHVIDKQPKTSDDHQLLTNLSNDSNPIVKSIATLKSQQPRKTSQTNVPFNVSRLTHQQAQPTHEHLCSGPPEPTLNLTQHISDVIDDMFPDEEELVLSVHRLDGGDPAAKRIKLDEEGDRQVVADAIAEIRRQVEILERMERLISPGQRRDVRVIGESLGRIAGQDR
ncbi:uncharacterized protein LOC119770314 [Culex quinquefasciatus]|uniref:uncharacterized protein LOC119770314 n=1 Tax=Culex quinquefasciatus TaxID=7176 RepID=UPI0018E2D94B|nr:uncharacterized protein LOC119770314 [Culex quinquefasciatus]